MIIAPILNEYPVLNNVIGQFLRRYLDPLPGTGVTICNDHRVKQLHVAWKESEILAQVNQLLTSDDSSSNIDCNMHHVSSNSPDREAHIVRSSNSERWKGNNGQLSIESMEKWPLL